MNNLLSGFALRAYEPDDLDALYQIESRATVLLAENGYPALLEGDAPPIEAFEQDLLGKGVWVAVSDHNGHPVGYAVAGDLDGVFWLYQMSVDPDFGRRGIGRALLTAVIDHARWAHYGAVGLSTFRNVAFNGPFYERAGFVAIDSAKLSSSVQKRFEAEVPDGVSSDERTVMIRRI